ADRRRHALHEPSDCRLTIADCQLPERERFMASIHVRILEVSDTHEPSRIEQRLGTCNLSLVTGDLQRSVPRVSQCPVTSYQLPVTSLMGVSLRGSWSQCAPNLASGLSMNHEP